MNFNQLTGRESKHLVDYGNFKLDSKTLESFLLLKESLEETSSIELELISSFRDFDRQALIWNEKAQGKRQLFNKKGQALDFSELSKPQILEAILTWSAIPGTSRHHWGTDIDVYDARVKNKSEVELSHNEYLSDFSTLSQELTKRIKINKSFNFYRPYSEESNGVSVELWHLSFLERSKQCDLAYTMQVFEKNIEQSEIELKDLILKNRKDIFERFIKNTSTPPLWP